MLDGKRGYAVWANAVPAHRSLALGALPTGLAGNVRLKPAVARDTVVAFDDAEPGDDADVVGLRRGMEGSARQAAVA